MESEKMLEIIKGYIVNELCEKHHYTREEADIKYDSSIFKELLKDNPDYILHYDVEYWSKYIHFNDNEK